jgi:tRNA 2-selenouridine synthase SelU
MVHVWAKNIRQMYLMTCLTASRKNITLKQIGERQPDLKQDSDLDLGSAFGLLDKSQSSGNDYEEEVFVREQEYETKHRRLKARKKGKRI